MNHRLIFANETMKEEIDCLRMQEYGNASGFSLDLNSLKWRQSDNDSFVMAAQADGVMVSTMRGEIISDIWLLEKKLECPWDFPFDLQLPVLLLSRAATMSTHRTAGLNLVQRYWFIRLAMENNIPSLVGTFVSGSPREKTLREMGYIFFENKLGWQESTYRSHRPVTVAVLDLKAEGERALRYCLDRAAAGIQLFQFDGVFPEFRNVRSL